MENANDKSTGNQLYILSQHDYQELRNIQTMLVVMAQASLGGEDEERESMLPTPTRSELNQFFVDVCKQMGSALGAIRKDDRVGPQRLGR
jgi:hypothetical protein